MSNVIFRKALVFAVFFALMACESTPPVTELPPTADPSVELSRLDRDISQAKADQIDILSPNNFKNAQNAETQAKANRSEDKKQIEILHQISVSRAYLNKANEVAKVSQQILPDVIQERRVALDANSAKFYPDELKSADQDLRSATEDIENNKTGTAIKTKESLQARYSELELKSIKISRLAEARAEVDEAVKEGAKKLTPQTLAWAENKIAESDKMITNSRHDPLVLENAAASAKASSARLLFIVRQAKSSTAKNPEQLAIQEEAERSAERHAEIKSQKQLEQAQSETENEKLAKEQEQQKVLALAAENQKQAAKEKLEQQYEAARHEFTDDEAEVYKQGDKLLLRLKGLKFPKDQAVITDDNYSILAKVQKVIKNSATNSVVVEGHADSTGSKILNDQLSAARAKAVQSYLTANNAVPEDKISAKGFGDEKPIATNKTKEGRAQNRRVDIIINNQE